MAIPIRKILAIKKVTPTGKPVAEYIKRPIPLIPPPTI